MREYKIVSGVCANTLEKIIQEYLNDGYLLAGGISITSNGGFYTYVQAIYKPCIII